ncbi:hypothetical protein BD770DRAFT_415065 [Pilaira anomala]|nr:hypothetical protein BD770DRAFT_415065 [Pilaira anomala]
MCWLDCRLHTTIFRRQHQLACQMLGLAQMEPRITKDAFPIQVYGQILEHEQHIYKNYESPCQVHFVQSHHSQLLSLQYKLLENYYNNAKLFYGTKILMSFVKLQRVTYAAGSIEAIVELGNYE